MGVGMSLESYSADAVFAAGTGAWDPNYGVANAGDLYLPSKVARVTGGAASLTGTLPGASPIGIVAVTNHNADTIRVQAGAYDSGVVATAPAVPGYRRTQPFIFPEISAALVTVTFGFVGTLDIGAIEIARFFELPGISPGAAVGFRRTGEDTELVGGGRIAARGGARRPRTFSGQLDRLAMAIAETRGLDFQKIKARSGPFVFVSDTATPASWSRGCWLARNAEVRPSVGASTRHDAWSIGLVEHFR